jgi:phosphotransferase system HPr-like phosphotransfer protein
MLGAEKDSQIVIEAEGDDAQSAIAELEKLVLSEE